MNIPWEQLQPETLQAVIEEFVSRDGTDYGQTEARFSTKVEQVLHLLKTKKAGIVFDLESGTCDIRVSD